tara:strand:+ start:41948 stop:43054 length:1107 start_codon:yes stop_codon:yes gene_type:complete
MLGGGQLGRFFVISAQNLGYQVTVLDPDQKSPAGLIADIHICAAYDDKSALDQIINTCFAVTTEFENIPFATLKYLENSLIVRPSSQAVSIVQNRIKEKNFLADNKFPVGPFHVIESEDQISKVPDNIFPAILKIAQFGYDGKGQVHVANSNELREAFIKSNYAPCILEKKLPLEIEVSVITARSMSGNHVFFPIAENEHINGILDTTISPGRVSNDIACKVKDYANDIAIKLGYVGVLAVEFFIVEGNIYINEIAPRPHNSGHYSLDACTNNQFDLQVRTLTDLELLDPNFHSNTVMINLLGDIWFKENKLREPNFNILIDEPKVYLHMYGKEEPRKGRKMAHFNVSGDNLNDLLVKASHLKQRLSN